MWVYRIWQLGINFLQGWKSPIFVAYAEAELGSVISRKNEMHFKISHRNFITQRCSSLYLHLDTLYHSQTFTVDATYSYERLHIKFNVKFKDARVTLDQIFEIISFVWQIILLFLILSAN